MALQMKFAVFKCIYDVCLAQFHSKLCELLPGTLFFFHFIELNGAVSLSACRYLYSFKTNKNMNLLKPSGFFTYHQV